MPKLIVDDLVKTFKSRCVVNHVSLKIANDEIVGLLGPNGAGKTTCFYMIVGLIPADQGSVLFNGKDLTLLTMDERAHLGIGYLPQEASVFRKMSVSDNIMAILELRTSLNQDQREQILTNLLHEFNIVHIKDNLGISLSGGERRRVEIARALAMEPKFILLDEPFAGVDPISVIDIKQIIIHLKKRGIGVLITDHNVRETLDICDRAYIMNEGQTICDGTPKTILQNQQVRNVYLGEEFDL